MNNKGSSSNSIKKRGKKDGSRRRIVRSIPSVRKSKVKGRNINARSKVSGTKRRNTRKKVANKQSQGVTIRRSSGRKETFSTDRMGQTVSRSGVPFMMARDIAKTVTKKIGNVSPKSQSQDQRKKQKKTSKTDKIISAGKVRQLVAEELRNRNRPDIANSYSGNPPENTAKQDYERTDNK
ncbi:hypothetical protein BH18THE2_BH18THE2_19770 [soil metagenome]